MAQTLRLLDKRGRPWSREDYKLGFVEDELITDLGRILVARDQEVGR